MDDSTTDPGQGSRAAQGAAGPEDRRPMDAVSVTAFVLSLVGAGIVAIPLGIWGVVRADSGRRRGEGLAVAALVVSAAWAVVAATFLVTSGVLGGGTLAKEREVYWADLQPTMCVRSTDDEAPDIPVVDCRAEHESEVMALIDLGGGDRYPGDEAIEAQGEVACRAAFADYVGLGYDESRLELDFWWSDTTGWEDGERTLVCLVEDPSQGMVSSALRGTAQ
jgi:Septum formation